MKIVFIILLTVIILVGLAFLIFYLLWFVPLRKKEPGFEYVCVDDDGSVRELDQEEVEYLSTKFAGADGARPYIKTSYGQLTPDKKIGGYIPRRRVPRHIQIKSTQTK
jgi:hypothetical protein